MKVSYGGRVRKVNVIPNTMGDFRRVVQQKFLNLRLDAPNEADASHLSRVLDDSELKGDNAEFSKLIDSQIEDRSALEESKAGSSVRRKGTKREKNTIDF